MERTMSDAEPLRLPVLGDADLASPEAGPKPTRSLRARHSPLASTREQRSTLDGLALGMARHAGDFEAALASAGWTGLHPAPLEIFQINLGKLCNMTCRHCHVDAGPDRTDEMMDRATVEACLAALDRTAAHTVDLTGGAPELNPNFRYLVDQAAARGKHVIDRCNLTVLLIASLRDLPAFLAERGVEIVCSLPHWRRRNTDAQRGDGAFEKSLAALGVLNTLGYGRGDPRRRLTLVANPVGAFLPSNQASLEREWKEGLLRAHGIVFDRLLTITNMPIARFLEWLEASGNLQRYMELIVNSFNPATVAGLMCRNTLSVAWDGRIYDCDFNQMLDLDARADGGGTFHVREFDPVALGRRRIVTGRHCFGCTAGAGSSCGGAIEG
jgi:radical SAM/Cys-rich protein